MKRDISEEEVARHWDENAETWAAHVRKGWDVCRETYNSGALLAMLGDVRGKRVLDAGCGEGQNTRLLARAGALVTGVDISTKMIDLARAEEKRQPLGIDYRTASFSNLARFGDGSFDAVASFMALMDGPDLGGAAEECYRVLRPGGAFVFSLSHPCFMTKGFGWAEGEGRKLTVGAYFDDEPWVERWRFNEAPDDTPPFEIPSFPRTLSEYVNTLIETGFVLERLGEPRPSEEACREHPWLRPWREDAALFLHVRARKPERVAAEE